MARREDNFREANVVRTLEVYRAEKGRDCVRTYHVKEGDKVQATLYYWEDTDEYQLVLTEDTTLVPYYDGVLGKVIPRGETKAWVRDRVIPPERDNIMEILSDIGHTDYKEIYFIDAIQGKCVRDPYYIVPVEEGV